MDINIINLMSEKIIQYRDKQINVTENIDEFFDMCVEEEKGALVAPSKNSAEILSGVAKLLQDNHTKKDIFYPNRDLPWSSYGIRLFCKNCLTELEFDYPPYFWKMVGLEPTDRIKFEVHLCPKCSSSDAYYVYLYRFEFGDDVKDALRLYWKFCAQNWWKRHDSSREYFCDSCSSPLKFNDENSYYRNGKMRCEFCNERNLKNWNGKNHIEFGDGQIWLALAYVKMKEIVLNSIRKEMENEPTEKLLKIWEERDTKKYSDEAFDVIRIILTNRGENLPLVREIPTHFKEKTEELSCQFIDKNQQTTIYEQKPGCSATMKKWWQFWKQ